MDFKKGMDHKMSLGSKKWLLCLAICLIWLSVCGFADLNLETTAGIGSVMDQLTGEDIEEFKILEEWDDRVLADVNEYVSVRAEANAESKVLGRLFKGDGGYILERAEGWTKIRSGNLEGYVSNEYLLFGMEAYEEAQEELELVATTNTAGLRIRSEASTDSKILKTVEKGTKLTAVEEETETASEETAEDTEDEVLSTGWVRVQYAEEKFGYVSEEYVTLQYELGEGMTMEEIKKKEAEEKKEKLKKKLAEFEANGNEVQLLAALIQAEAGNQPHEGKVAVGAVVMNRVRSGRGSIAQVIYAPGQFGPASNGALDRYLANPSASCIQAAQEAISGYTNIGNYTHFRRANVDMGPNSIVIGAHVFY